MGEKVERVTEFEDVLGFMLSIGSLKNSLPFGIRGHIASLGLHVQFREAGGVQRLNAGGKFKPYFDVVNPDASNLSALYGGEDIVKYWEVKKFDKATWNLRFAHLVEPTFDIALFLIDYIGKPDEKASAMFKRVVDHFKATGEWLGLPSGRSCADCGQDVTLGQWRREYCPNCGAKLQK